VIAAQGGNAQVWNRFDLLPTRRRQGHQHDRGGYVSAIDAELIGQASSMIGRAAIQRKIRNRSRRWA